MRKISATEAKEVNGGAKYWYCRICGYKNKSYWKVYKNALGCVILKGIDFVFPPVEVY